MQASEHRIFARSSFALSETTCIVRTRIIDRFGGTVFARSPCRSGVFATVQQSHIQPKRSQQARVAPLGYRRSGQDHPPAPASPDRCGAKSVTPTVTPEKNQS